MIPKTGEMVRVGVTLRNMSDAPLPVPLIVALRDSAPDRPDKIIGKHAVVAPFAHGEARDVAFSWKPLTNDWHTLTFTATFPRKSRLTSDSLSVRVPVVNRDLYFAWFGSPVNFKWCNVPTTVKSEDEERVWLRRGAMPCHWKGGVCYKDWTAEQFAADYVQHRCIAIDEVGGPGEVTDKILAAIREHKRRHPDGFVAVWFMGAHDYWREIADVVDLFLPEIYLNYGGNHLGRFAPYLRVTRATGTAHKCIPALGINVIKDEKTGEVRVSPTREDVLRQIQHLKRVAPDWVGVGFFTSYSAAPGVAEYADELCEQYYLNPVLSVTDLRVIPSAGKSAIGASGAARVAIKNVGGTPARNVQWVAGWTGHTDEMRSGRSQLKAVRGTIRRIAPGQTESLQFALNLPRGINVLSFSLMPQKEVTLLDPTITRVVARVVTPPQSRLIALRPLALPRWDVLVSIPWQEGNWTVEELDAIGKSIRKLPAAVRPLTPGSDEVRLQFLASGLTASGGRRFFLVRRSAVAVQQKERRVGEGQISIERGSFRAEIDLSRGLLRSLRVGNKQTELLKSAWSFACPGAEVIGVTQITESALGTEVFIPFNTPELTGGTRYTFYRNTPLIEIARRLVPRQALQVKGASEGCAIEQRGGTFALQAGVGALVNRGQLQDSDKYRDLLFGYLGEPPRPDNADCCGWFDFSWQRDEDAGLGVVLARRWKDAATESYDVTRYYDGSDWLQINYVWGVETTIERPQESVVYLLPHGFVDFALREALSPAQELWETLHSGVEIVD